VINLEYVYCIKTVDVNTKKISYPEAMKYRDYNYCYQEHISISVDVNTE